MFVCFSLSFSLSLSIFLNLSQSLSLSFSLSLFHFLRSPFSLSTTHTITSLSLIIVVNINVVISSRFSPTPNTFLHFFFPLLFLSFFSSYAYIVCTFTCKCFMRVRVFSFVTSHPFRTRFRTPAIGKRQKGSESTERERKEEEKKKNGKGD